MIDPTLEAPPLAFIPRVTQRDVAAASTRMMVSRNGWTGLRMVQLGELSAARQALEGERGTRNLATLRALTNRTGDLLSPDRS